MDDKKKELDELIQSLKKEIEESKVQKAKILDELTKKLEEIKHKRNG